MPVRGRRRAAGPALTAAGTGEMLRRELALEVPPPFLGEALLVFLGRHAVPGFEACRDRVEDGRRRIDYARTLRLPHGPAVIELSWADGLLGATLQVSEVADLDRGRAAVERLCDLGHDVAAAEDPLGGDPVLGPMVRSAPGLRVPGVVDVAEHLLRTMIGQQISLAAAAVCTAKLVRRYGDPWPPSPEAGGSTPAGTLERLFPRTEELAAADPATLAMPVARGRALVAAARALAAGELVLSVEADPVATRSQLLALRGVGPWTADYVLMRGLAQPDIVLASDLVVARELERLGFPDARRWSPWRSYATMHLWRAWTG